jgi:hypothetical protein
MVAGRGAGCVATAVLIAVWVVLVAHVAVGHSRSGVMRGDYKMTVPTHEQQLLHLLQCSKSGLKLEFTSIGLENESSLSPPLTGSTSCSGAGSQA